MTRQRSICNNVDTIGGDRTIYASLFLHLLTKIIGFAGELINLALGRDFLDSAKARQGGFSKP